MRYFCGFLMLVILGVGSIVMGQATTMPSSRISVMIFPFRQLGDINGHEWVSEALHDQLTSALSGSTAVQLMNYDRSLGAATPEGALAAARTAQADYVVYGTYQIVDDTLRVNGHVEDAVRQQQISTLQATGNIRDFFKLEDDLAQQFRQAFPLMNVPNYGIQTNSGSYSSSVTTNQSGIYPYSNIVPNGGSPAVVNPYYGGGTDIYPYSSYYSQPLYDNAYYYPYAGYYDSYPLGYAYPYVGVGIYGGYGFYGHGRNYGGGFHNGGFHGGFGGFHGGFGGGFHGGGGGHR